MLQTPKQLVDRGRRSVFGAAAVAALAALAILLASARLPLVEAAKSSPGTSSLSKPDLACAGCHRDIFAEYERTPMANGSGSAMQGLIAGGFTHAPSGISYRVYEQDGTAMLSFDRNSRDAETQNGALHGTRRLEYFIGSNHRGRTYLYREGKQWFEAPVNFYSKRGLWDMAPNFGAARSMPAPLPTDANCLHCHATAVAAPLPQAANAFAAEPLAQGGVGCSACHGDPAQHLASKGRDPIVNPARLSPSRRDSACLQCHLEGDATVYRPGRSLAGFRAGDDLADFAVAFVKASRESGGGRASSQYEALLRSACKRASGDKLTCTTCHDPHSSPAPAERVAWFRSRCLTCHASPAIAERHHPEQQDCAVCHMPTRAASDISHEQATDHNIQSRPAASQSTSLRLLSLGDPEELIPVGAFPASDRELGLAYAQFAVAGDRSSGQRAQRLLKSARAGGANDATLNSSLGYLDQISGDPIAARREYGLAIQTDPSNTTALGNLAVLEASQGKSTEAMRLLQRVVDADPSKTAAGLNLALLQCRTGQEQKVQDLLARLSAVNPDDPALRAFLATGKYLGQSCAAAKTPKDLHAP